MISFFLHKHLALFPLSLYPAPVVSSAIPSPSSELLRSSEHTGVYSGCYKLRHLVNVRANFSWNVIDRSRRSVYSSLLRVSFGAVAKFWNTLMHVNDAYVEEGNGERNARSEFMVFHNPLGFLYLSLDLGNISSSIEPRIMDTLQSFPQKGKHSDLSLYDTTFAKYLEIFIKFITTDEKKRNYSNWKDF